MQHLAIEPTIDDHAQDAYVTIDTYRRVQRRLIASEHVALTRIDRIAELEEKMAELRRECKVWRIYAAATAGAFLLAKHWGLM